MSGALECGLPQLALRQFASAKCPLWIKAWLKWRMGATRDGRCCHHVQATSSSTSSNTAQALLTSTPHKRRTRTITIGTLRRPSARGRLSERSQLRCSVVHRSVAQSLLHLPSTLPSHDPDVQVVFSHSLNARGRLIASGETEVVSPAKHKRDNAEAIFS